jgi:hypothetical protein
VDWANFLLLKIALSKAIIFKTMDEVELSGSQKSREEPQFQQDASANEPLLAGKLVIGRSGGFTLDPQSGIALSTSPCEMHGFGLLLKRAGGPRAISRSPDSGPEHRERIQQLHDRNP